MIISFSIFFKRSHNSGFLISKFKFDQFLVIFSFCCHFIFVLWQFYQRVSGESLISRKSEAQRFFLYEKKNNFFRDFAIAVEIKWDSFCYCDFGVFVFFLLKTHKQKKITAVHRTLNSFRKYYLYFLEYHCRVILKCKDIKI